ncbi:hypothetical protein GCM10017673_37450 [Streptosporangium violaceochromogenes]|nr:hypothetical protein GCM10017673_37450 [Streptosporangium violaceochromogenes]
MPQTTGGVDVRAFVVRDLPHFPAALLYVSTPIGDPRVEAFVEYAVHLGLPRTSTYDHDGAPGYDLLPAGRGWRLELTPSLRLRVRAQGNVIAEVARTSAPPEWVTGALGERRALVVVGGPIPFMAGESNLGELLSWVCSHPTASGVMPAVEMPD